MFKKSFFIVLVLTGLVQAAQRPVQGFNTPPRQRQTARPSVSNNRPMTQAEMRARDIQLKKLDQQRKMDRAR